MLECDGCCVGVELVLFELFGIRWVVIVCAEEEMIELVHDNT